MHYLCFSLCCNSPFSGMLALFTMTYGISCDDCNCVYYNKKCHGCIVCLSAFFLSKHWLVRFCHWTPAMLSSFKHFTNVLCPSLFWFIFIGQQPSIFTCHWKEALFYTQCTTLVSKQLCLFCLQVPLNVLFCHFHELKHAFFKYPQIHLQGKRIFKI